LQEDEIAHITDELNKGFATHEGPFVKELDSTLQMLGVTRQQYFGGVFVGNHVHKSLQARILIKIRTITPCMYYRILMHQFYISSIEALCGAMAATAQREIPSILSDVMATATTLRSILAQFGSCHELYDGNYINEYNASQLGR
jgi:hypothetical protein